MSDLDEQLDRMCADGRITVHDADEVRRFADFLIDTAGKSGPEKARAYFEHYPEYAPAATTDSPTAHGAAGSASPTA